MLTFKEVYKCKECYEIFQVLLKYCIECGSAEFDEEKLSTTAFCQIFDHQKNEDLIKLEQGCPAFFTPTVTEFYREHGLFDCVCCGQEIPGYTGIAHETIAS